jgi:predicted nucleic acid-binding protein
MNAIENQKQFVDTNIFTYAYDLSAPDKSKIAKKLIAGLWESGLGVISIQVLQELYVNLSRKLPNTISREQSAQIITDLGHWHLHRPNLTDLQQALNIEREHNISFWDAMIVSSAVQMKCKVLWTEDLNSGQYIEDLAILNPFPGK